jgi:hypothetical protein
MELDESREALMWKWLAISSAVLAGSGAWAQTPGSSPAGEAAPKTTPQFANKCVTAEYEELDFLVGEWLVSDKASGKLQGLDVIQKDLEGCAIVGRWTQLNDDYKAHGERGRLKSLNMFFVARDGGAWRLATQDSLGFSGFLTRIPTADGAATFESEPFKRATWRLSWKRMDDGTLESWGDFKPVGSSDWRRAYHNVGKASG